MIRDLRDYRRTGDTSDSDAFDRALDACGGNHDEGGHRLYIPRKPDGSRWRLGRTINFGGRGCSGMYGDGDGTVIQKLPGWTGPIWTLDGYLGPRSAMGLREFGNFSLVGDGVPDPGNIGINLSGHTGMVYRNITVMNTGGTCIRSDDTQYSYLENLVLVTPVEADVRDTPYFEVRGAFNGNSVRIGLRGYQPTMGLVGPSGAIRLLGQGDFSPNANHIRGWLEYLVCAEHGCIFYSQGSANLIQSFLMHDCSAAPGAIDTCVYVFDNPPPGCENVGANMLMGIAPGNGNEHRNISRGVKLIQSGNFLVGPKGYWGDNVHFFPGTTRNTVILGGSVSHADGPAVLDESGNRTNTVCDYVNDPEPVPLPLPGP